MFKKFILLVLLFPSMVQPFVSYALLEKDGKLVFIAGDLHISQFDELNAKHCDTLIENVLKSSEYEQDPKVDCFLEFEPRAEAIIKQAAGNLSQLRRIEALSSKTFFNLLAYAGNNNVLNFNLIEPRGSESNFTNGIFSKISEIVLNSQGGNFNFNEFKSYLQGLLASNNDMSVDKYFEILMTHLINIRGLLMSCEFDVKSLHILENYYQKYYEGVNQIVGLLKDEDRKSLGNAIINSFKNVTTNQEATDKYKQLSNCITKTDNLLADIYFFNSIIQNQSEKSKTMIIAGDSHAKQLVTMLSECGYSVVDKLTTGSTDAGYDIHPDFMDVFQSAIDLFLLEDNLDEIKSASEAIAKMNIKKKEMIEERERLLLEQEKIMAETQEIIDQALTLAIQVNMIECNACQKESTLEKLQKCARCKQAYYCNVDCQKSDWKKHKKDCVAAK